MSRFGLKDIEVYNDWNVLINNIKLTYDYVFLRLKMVVYKITSTTILKVYSSK